jgi:hypothetical protein
VSVTPGSYFFWAPAGALSMSTHKAIADSHSYRAFMTIPPLNDVDGCWRNV